MSHEPFLDKTLRSIARITDQALFSEEYARKDGLLQSLDVRARLISLVFILVLISLAREPETLWLFCAAALSLAALSRVPIIYFITRAWLVAPLFTAAIVLPATLNLITPGDPVLVLATLEQPYAWGPYVVPQEIAITRQGLWGAVMLLSRVTASVSFAVLIMLTARWNDLITGLRSLFVPRVFVMVLSMTYRYLAVFLRLIEDMYKARKSRTIQRLSSAEERNWVASRIGAVFSKSLELSRDIHRAMLSRGYHGEALALPLGRLGARDVFWTMILLGASVIILLLERGS